VTRIALLALVVLLAGCVTTPPPAGAPPPEVQWILHGRLAAHAGDEQWFGNFTWQQRPHGYRIELSGPLGQGAVRLREDADGATLEMASDEIYRDSDTENLLRRHLGWFLPVNGLRSWIVGEPAPGAVEGLQRDANGRMVELDQDGWRIALDRYRSVDGRELPHRVKLERAELRLRLVIDSWQIGAGAPG